MNRIIAYMTLLFSLSSACSSPNDGYKISGIVKETNDGPYLDYIYMGYGEVKDSALVGGSGQFEFTGKLQHPTRVYLHLKPPSASVGFYLENSQVFVSGQFYESFQNDTNYNLFYMDSVAGSRSNDLVVAYREYKKANQSKSNYEELIVDKLTTMAHENPKNSIIGTLLADEAVKSNKIFTLEELKKAHSYLDSAYQIHAEMALIERGIQQLEASRLGDQFIDFTISGDRR
ncbi:MAG: DUF4369 domain-containing protein, partial [Bacteroidota bacterium]